MPRIFIAENFHNIITGFAECLKNFAGFCISHEKNFDKKFPNANQVHEQDKICFVITITTQSSC